MLRPDEADARYGDMPSAQFPNRAAQQRGHRQGPSSLGPARAVPAELLRRAAGDWRCHHQAARRGAQGAPPHDPVGAVMPNKSKSGVKSHVKASKRSPVLEAQPAPTKARAGRQARAARLEETEAPAVAPAKEILELPDI